MWVMDPLELIRIPVFMIDTTKLFEQYLSCEGNFLTQVQENGTQIRLEPLSEQDLSYIVFTDEWKDPTRYFPLRHSRTGDLVTVILGCNGTFCKLI